MDDFDIDALDNVDFEATAQKVAAKQDEADQAAAKEMEALRENANVCESGSCTI